MELTCLSEFLIWWAADSQIGDYERAESLARMGSEFYPAMGGQHTVPHMKAIMARTLGQLGTTGAALRLVQGGLLYARYEGGESCSRRTPTRVL